MRKSPALPVLVLALALAGRLPAAPAPDPVAACLAHLGPHLVIASVDELVAAHGPGKVRRAWELLRRRAPGLLADPALYALALRAFPRDPAAQPGPDAKRARAELEARGGGPALRDARTGRAFVELVHRAKIGERLVAASAAEQAQPPPGAPGGTADRTPPGPADPVRSENPVARARARLAGLPPPPAPAPDPPPARQPAP